MKIADIKKDISQLSIQEKATLANWIITNIDGVFEKENDVDAAWRHEIRSRVEEIKTGKVKMIPAEDMWKDLLSGYEKTSWSAGQSEEST